MVKRSIFLILGFITLQMQAQLLKPLALGVADEVVSTTTDDSYFYVATRRAYNGPGKGFSIIVNKWNGFFWQSLPAVTFNDSSQVRTMVVFRKQVYLAGNFSVKVPASITTKTMVRFNSSLNKWESVFTNGTTGFTFLGAGYGSINAMAVYQNQLFIAGAFYTIVNGDTTQNIVSYNGTSFSKCGAGSLGNSGTNGAINSLLVLNDSLFLGGSFTKAGGATALNLAVLDSSLSWKSLFIPAAIGVVKLISYKNNLALLINDIQGKILLRNGNTFQVITSNLTSVQISDIEEFNNELWASGSFYSGSASLVKYSTTWTSLNLPTVTIYDLLKFKTGLYLISANEFAGGVKINRVAQVVFSHTRISGHVYEDLNHNCKFDNTDRPFANKMIQVVGTDIFNLTTDINGFYSATINTSTTPFYINLVKFKNWAVDSPCSRSYYSVTTATNSVNDTLDFSMRPLAHGADIQVKITPNNGYRSHADLLEEYIITFSNNGTQDLTTAAGVKVVFDKKLSNFSSPNAYVLNGNEASWSVGLLKVGENHSISFMAKAKSDSFHLSDKLSFIASSALSDLDAFDNADTLVQRIEQSAPIQVFKDVFPLPAVDDSFSLVTTARNEINYIIHFENTSLTDTIHNVIVIDTIDINSSIQYIQETGSSHIYSTNIFSCPAALGKGVIVWTFSNINLAPWENTDDVMNRGHIGFKIKFNSNLPLGTVIKNKAHVVFDYYDPLQTNNTYAKVSDHLNGVGSAKQILKSKPICANPVKNKIVLFNTYKPNANYEIINAEGRVVLQGEVNSKTINIEALVSGIYFLVIKEENQLTSQKIMIN